MENRLGSFTATRAAVARRGRTTAVLSAAAVASVLVAVPARASSLQPIAQNTVEQLPDPGTTLAVPADGQINGYGFAGNVLGAAVGTTLPTEAVKAAAGQKLWVFGLRWTADVSYPQDASPEVTRVAATVIVEGNRLPIPVSQPQAPAGGQNPPQIDSGAQYFAASLPADPGDVVVELSSSGFAQDFSLTHMTPEGPRPAALYPALGNWQTANQLTLEHDIPTPFNDAYSAYPDAELAVKVGQVSLSYFAPDGASDIAPGLSQAWLVPALTDTSVIPSHPGDNLQYQANVTAADMTVTLPGGTVVHPDTFPGGPDPTGNLSFGSSSALFPWQYAFPVPAATTQARLTISFPAEPTAVAWQSGDPGETFNLPPVAFTLTLPPPQPATPPPGAASTPSAIHPLAAATSASHSRSSDGASGFQVVLVAALAGIAAFAAAGVLFVRRRRLAVAHPVSGGFTVSPSSQTTEAAPTDHYQPAYTGRPHGDAGDRLSQERRSQNAPTIVERAEPLGSEQPSNETAEFVPPRPPVLRGLVVRVLGLIDVAGWTNPPGRGPLIPMVVYLAVKRRQRISLSKIRQAMSIDAKQTDSKQSDAAGDATNADRSCSELTNQTVRSNLSRLRRALAPGQLPDSLGKGYQLKDVTLDWDVFQQLAAQGEAAERRRDQPAAIEAYSQALALVRGLPYETDGGYGWVDKEDLRSPIEVATAKTAGRLARLAVAAGQPQLAVWAARQALLANPADEDLVTVALDAAAVTGQVATIRRQWTAITRKMRAAGVQPSAQLEAHCQGLIDDIDNGIVPSQPDPDDAA